MDTSYKPYKRALQVADRIVEQVISFNIDKPWSLTFKACCVFFFMAEMGTNRYDKIVFAFRNKIAWSECQKFVYNWKRFGRYKSGKFNFDFNPDNPIANVIELTLLCMLAADEVTCVEVSEEKSSDSSYFLKAV